MMLFKNNKKFCASNFNRCLPSQTNGFSFIEMMIALTLLAVFGTSLFLVQTNILSKILTTHRLVAQSNDIDQELQQFQMQLHQAILQKKAPETATLSITKQNPDRTISIKLNPIAEKSSLHKIFAKQVRMTQITIKQDQYQTTWYSLLYIPAINPKPEAQAKNKTEVAT